MAKVLAVLTSGRRKGFTSGLLEKALDGVRDKGVEVDYVWLPKYNIKPCIACFKCVKDEEHRCVQNDDMGKKGEGELVKKLKDTNALLIADPVYFWGATSGIHLFFERMYQFLWTGGLSGLPVATISCASNQGMMREATRNLCKWSFQMKLRYINGLSVHTAYYEEAEKQSYFLGQEVGQAAINDENERKMLTERDAFIHYSDTPWRPFELYIDNLTLGSSSWVDSMPFKALSESRFKNPEAVEALRKAVDSLRATIRHYDWGDGEAANEKLVKTASFWTEATWKEFLEEGVMGTGKPEGYRSRSGVDE